MTAEQLNIKIKLDISDVAKGAKKVKDGLSGVADKAKQSLPKVSKESKGAKKALGDVGDAGKKVQDKLKGIGTQARDSLGDVVAYGKKATQTLKNIKTDNKFSLGFDFDSEGAVDGIDSASGAIDSLQTSMTLLTGSNVLEIISKHFDKIKKIFSSFAEAISDSFTWELDLSGNLYKIRKELRHLGEAFKNFRPKDVNKLKEAFKNLGKPEDVKKLKDAFKNLGEVIKKSFKGAAKFVGDVTKSIASLATSIVGKITAIASAAALLATAKIGFNIARDTKQYREEHSKLVSAFQASGSSAEQATQSYNNLFRFLGQSDQAVEAANHLAKLTNNTQHLAEWTTICQGIYATFGKSLAIEGLTESANETARVGKVTGTLADALNWAGISEDAMNAALEKTTSLSEREALIRKTLNGIYQDAARIYEQNNKHIIAQNEAQARLDATLARVGQQTQVLVVSWINFKNTLLTAVAPAIIYVSAAMSVLIDKLSQFIKWLGSLFGISFDVGNIGGIVDGVGSGLNNAVGGADNLKDSLDAATGAAEKLKRTTMGFDELNIVSNPNTSSGGGTDTDVGVGDVTGGLTAGNGVLSQMGEQIELIKDKVSAFFDKWKTEIAIIGGALATLGVAKLLEGLGKALGATKEFMKLMKDIKKLAATAITIVLQYTLMSEFLENYINGEGFKEYLKALLVGAIGTGVLYALWGTTGLVIGLGVTAVAALKTVFDNGGITNAESATVALTGLAAAIGAVGIAWKKLGLGAIAATVIGFFKDLTLAIKGVTFVPQTAAFTKFSAAITAFVAKMKGIPAAIKGIPVAIKGAFAGIGTAIKGAIGAVGSFAGTIGSLFGATGGAAIAAGAAVIVAAISAVVGVVVFLKRNWEEMGIVIKNFFNENIVPKLEGIKVAIQNAGSALANMLPEGLKQALADIWQGIKNIISAIGEWFASVEWLQAIGTAFEWVGGVVVSVVGGTIAGAINGLVSLLQGAIEIISGAVQIVAGLIEAIIGLFTGDLQRAGDAVKKMADGIVNCFKGLYKATIGVVVDFVKGIIKWFTEMWDVLVGHSIVPDMVKAIIDWFWKLPKEILKMMSDFVKNVIKLFTELAKKAAEKFKEIVDNIKNAWKNVKNTWDVVGKYFSDIWNSIQKTFSNTATWFKNMFQNAWNGIKNIWDAAGTYFSNIWNRIKTIFNETATWFKNMFQNAWNGIKNIWNAAGGYFSNVWTSIKNAFSNTVTWFKSIFQEAWNGIKAIFSNVSTYFTGVWNTIKNIFSNVGTTIANGISSAVKSAINAVLRTVTNKINSFISMINGAIDIINKIPGVSLGYISKLSVPQLASGGIVTSETLARIGERGKKEAVLPLEQNTGWMDILADKIASKGNNNNNAAPTKIVLQVGETELGWATIKSINNITKQQGGLQLHIV